MNVLPFRRSQTVATDAMAETEMQSSIPPWPIDFGRVEVADEVVGPARVMPPPRRVPWLEDDPIEGAGAVAIPVLVALVGVVGFALFAALV